MSHSTHWIVPPILLLLLNTGGCSIVGADSTRAPNGPILPLHVGNTWTLTLQSERNSQGPSFRISRTQTVVGHLYYVLEVGDGSTAYKVRADAAGRIYRRIDGEEHVWFDPTVADGSTYTSHQYAQYTVTVTQNVTVETPVGTFQNGIRFYFDAPRVVDEEHEWVLVPGVGIVRWSNAWFGPRLLADYDVGPL